LSTPTASQQLRFIPTRSKLSLRSPSIRGAHCLPDRERLP
jgi:hypothetical protein